MNTLRGHFAFTDKQFFTKTFLLFIPVVLQQLITVGINFLDNIMIGSFGETTIAAAAFGNQIYNLFQFICMGLGSGAIVMSSQFWGRKDTAAMRTTAAIALRVTAVLCAIFTLLCVIWPGSMLRVFTGDASVIIVGIPYLRLIGVTFLLAGLSSTATYLLRSVRTVHISFIGSAVAFVLNLFFNWVFIFGKLGAPRLELLGAAAGTVIARVFEFLFVFGYFILKDKKFGFRIRDLALSGKHLWSQYVKFSIPVLVSDTLLGLSLSIISMIFGHMSAEVASANSISGSLIQIVSVLTYGLGGASAVVIGNTIGEGEIRRAKQEGNTYILLSFLVGLVMLVPLLLLEQAYIGLYSVGDETRELVQVMLKTLYFMLPVQAVAYITSKGILRGGGDTRFLLLADSSLIWFVSIPLGALAAFVWHLSPFWVFLFIKIEYPLKGIVCFIRYCTGKWIKEIHSDR